MWTEKWIISIFSDFRSQLFRLRGKQHEMGKGDKKGSSLCCFKVLNERRGGKIGAEVGKSSCFGGKLKIFADVFNVKWLSSILHHPQRAAFTIVVLLSSNYFPHFRQWWCLPAFNPYCFLSLTLLNLSESRISKKNNLKCFRKNFDPFKDSQKSSLVSFPCWTILKTCRTPDDILARDSIPWRPFDWNFARNTWRTARISNWFNSPKTLKRFPWEYRRFPRLWIELQTIIDNDDTFDVIKIRMS